MVKIVYEKGIPFIDIDGKRLDPAAFRSFRPRPDNISLAARAGTEKGKMLIQAEADGLAPAVLSIELE